MAACKYCLDHPAMSGDDTCYECIKAMFGLEWMLRTEPGRQCVSEMLKEADEKAKMSEVEGG
jgi:hypothetical protein